MSRLIRGIRYFKEISVLRQYTAMGLLCLMQFYPFYVLMTGIITDVCWGRIMAGVGNMASDAVLYA